jgi:hypothetical protein
MMKGKLGWGVAWVMAGAVLLAGTVAAYAQREADRGKRVVELPTKRVVAEATQPAPPVEGDNTRVAPGKVKWHADLETARKAASQSGKPLFIFYMLGKLDENFCSTNARLARTVLFSRDDVSTFINANFEPVWVSVRPVPVLRIDFGDGRVLTRTLHGNTLTVVCAANGTVLDALPGVYAPQDYVERLFPLALLARQFRQSAQVGPRLPEHGQTARVAEVAREFALQEYHRAAAAALKADQPEPLLPTLQRIEEPRRDVGKLKIERRTEILVAVSAPVLVENPFNTPLTPAGWKELVQDTQRNEKARRLAIHELLAQRGSAQPETVLKPIFKDALSVDLDDPYLGLSKTLFEHYPFAEEDSKPR